MTEDPAATAQPQSSLEVAARAPEAPRAPSPTMRPAPRPKAPGEEDRRFPRFVSDAVDTVARTLAAEEEVDMFFFGRVQEGGDVWGADLSDLGARARLRTVCHYTDAALPPRATCRALAQANAELLHAAAFEDTSDPFSVCHIAVWSVAMQRRAERIVKAPLPVRALRFSGDDGLMAGLADGRMWMWDLRRPGFMPVQQTVFNKRDPPPESCTKGQQSPIVALCDRRYLRKAPTFNCVHESGLMNYWEHGTSRSAPRLVDSHNFKTTAFSAAFQFGRTSDEHGVSEKVTRAVVGDALGNIFFRMMSDKSATDKQKGEEEKKVPMSGPVTALAFVDPEMLVAGTASGEIATFHVPKYGEIGDVASLRLSAHWTPSALNTLAPSPSGRVLATTDVEGFFSIYSMEKLTQPCRTPRIQPLLQTDGVDPRAASIEWLDERNCIVPAPGASVALLRAEFGGA